MAAKSKKVPVKKSAKKKAPSGKPVRNQARAVEVEVVSEIPDLIPPEVEKQILKVESLIARTDDITDADLLKGIQTYSEQASRYSQIALKAGASALAYALIFIHFLKC